MLNLKNADACYEALAADALLLTPNHRLAVALHECYAAERKRRQLGPVYSSPAIYAIDIWIREQWQALSWQQPQQAWPQLLLPSHERLLWRDIIRDSAVGSHIFNPDATARAASEAHNLMQQYDLSGKQVQDWLKDNWLLREDYLDISHFLLWRDSFLEVLSRSSLLTLTQITSELTHLLAQSTLATPKQVLLFGFSSPPPLYHKILLLLTNNNIEQASLTLATSQPASCHLHAHSSAIEEARAAIDWAATIADSEPTSRIGLLCPDLSSKADMLQRLLSQRLDSKKFNISNSNSLDQRPLIATALNILDLNQDSLDTLGCCRLLQSPFLSQAPEEWPRLAALEIRLRNKGEQQLSPAMLRALCQQQGAAFHCPELGHRLQQFAEMARHHSNKPQPLSHWITLIQQQLTIMGWPGMQQLGQNERHDLDAWQQLLDDFLRCQAYQAPMPYLQALSLLRRLAINQRQGQQHFNAQIQVMTPAEAEHLQFSHLWIMDMSDQQWPPVMDNNSLIPWPLQQQYQFPLCRREDHQEWHKQLILRLASLTSREFIISYTDMLDDVPAKACAVARQVCSEQDVASTIEHGDSTLPPVFYQLSNSDQTLVREESPYLALTQQEQPRGGASLLQNQAICPFKSFAIHRLHAQELQVPDYGLSAMASGTLLHAAMEHLWQALHSYSQLEESSVEARQALCSQACKQAINDTARHYPQLMQPRFKQLEQQRLQELLLNWLEEEDKRQFSHIVELEKSITWSRGHLQLRLKLDRLEKLADNSLSIIDYKSGRKTTINWLDSRPEQPQLLLYLDAVEKLYPQETVNAVLLAYINSEEPKFSGCCNVDTHYAGIALHDIRNKQQAAVDWNELKNLWAQSLDRLADEFNEGLFSVSPKKANVHCRYCHIKPFCRIQESISALEDEGALD